MWALPSRINAQAGLADTTADGKGKLACQQHLMEGKGAALIAAGGGELAVRAAGSTRIPMEDTSKATPARDFTAGYHR
jgi:hypothetical protein